MRIGAAPWANDGANMSVIFGVGGGGEMRFDKEMIRKPCKATEFRWTDIAAASTRRLAAFDGRPGTRLLTRPLCRASQASK